MTTMWQTEQLSQTWVRIRDVYVPLDNIASFEVQEDTRAGKGGQWQIFIRFKNGGGTTADNLISREAAHQLVLNCLGTQVPVPA